MKAHELMNKTWRDLCSVEWTDGRGNYVWAAEKSEALAKFETIWSIWELDATTIVRTGRS